jgi:hypothetical protein
LARHRTNWQQALVDDDWPRFVCLEALGAILR